MRWFGLLIILATLATTTSLQAEDWTLANGKTLKNVVIVAQEGDGVRITYDGGVGKFPYYELPDPIIIRLGQDPATMAIKRAAARKAESDAALQAQQDAAAAAEVKKQQADAAAVDAAMKAAQGQTPTPAPTPGSNPTTPGTAPSPTTPGATATTTPVPAPAPAPVAPPPPPPPPVIPPPAPATAAASGPPDEQQAAYPNSKYNYDEGSDISYLDSQPISIAPMTVDAAPTPGAAPAAPSANASLYLRIVTEGHRAEAPDEVEGVFVSPTPLKNLATNNKVVFLVDGAFIPTNPPDPTDSSDPVSTIQVNFFLTPEHMKTMMHGKKVNITVGTYQYQIDDTGLGTFRAFLGDVDHLPAASTNFARTYHHIVNRLPSIITMISSACEYIILGAFGLVMVAAIAAFVMGLTRFIKM